MPSLSAIPDFQLVAESQKIQPRLVLDYTDLGDLHSAALSPDGTRLYALLHAQFVDLGQAIAHYWPEWGAAAIALAVLILLVPLVRRLRRRQTDGDPYCRRCNYSLRDRTADQACVCPECGLDLAKRPPIRGRRAWKRAWPIAALLALVLGAYGSLWAFKVRREVVWLHPQWCSTAALKWCDKPSMAWLTQFKRKGDLVIASDASTGERLRIVCGRASATYFRLVLTPDGSGLYLVRTDSSGIDLVSVGSGRTRATFTAGPRGAPGAGGAGRGEFCYDIGGDAVIGHTADGSVLLSYWSDSKALASAVLWNPTTGKTTIIATTKAYIDERSGRSFCQGRQFVRVGTAEPVQVISTPLFMEAFPTKTFEVRWFGQDGAETRKVDLKESVAPHEYPAITPAGDLAIFSEQYGRALISLDLQTGEEAGRISAEVGTGPPVFAADGVRLLVPARDGVLIRDTARKQWTALLREPQGFYGARHVTSPTASRAAAVFQGQPVANKFPFRAAIWDIP
jgi:hypothetical protein